MNDPFQIAAAIKQKAKALGFDLAGIAPAAVSKYRDYYRAWLDDGKAGTMQYLANRFDERTDPQIYMPGVASIVCVGLNYFVPLEKIEDEKPQGKIARYALGNDYHELIKDRLHALADFIREFDPAAETKCSVDTAPIMEKEIAASAGIGWIGKNACLINPQIGSWLLLGEVMTTLNLPADQPAVDRCGSCQKCIDACPTAAITEPYQLDARKCISYLTIEHREELPTELKDKLTGWIFGCDICQDVCPWNRKAPATTDPALSPRFTTGSIDLENLLTWTPEDYRQKLTHSAIKRVKLPILQRNARQALQNK